MYEQFDKQTLTSSSHLTVSQNIELRNLLNDCNRMATSGNLNGWRWKLDAVQRELHFDLVRLDKDNENEKTSFSSRLKAVETNISLTTLSKPVTIKDFNKKRDKIYKLLAEKEIILRELQEKAGKGTKRTHADEDFDDDE